MKFSPLFLPHSHAKRVAPEISEFLHEVSVHNKRVFEEYDYAFDFLMEYYNNKNNYKSIRSDLCIFLNWVWNVRRKSVVDVTRKDMFDFVEFGNNPPEELVAGYSGMPIIKDEPKKVPFDYEPILNEDWQPFVNLEKKNGKPYIRKFATLKRQLSIVSSFYAYLGEMEVTDKNPAAIATRKFTEGNVGNVGITDVDKEKALSQVQVTCIVELLEYLCELNPEKYERSRFLFYLLVLAYPRRSEIAARPTHSPTFSDFRRHRTSSGKYYYTFYIPRSKWSKSRSVLVSDELLDALKRYRVFLGLNPLPTASETNIPLFVRHRAASHGRQAGLVNANLGDEQISELVKELYMLAADVLVERGEIEEAEELRTFTVHSLRHLGITNDLYSGRSADDVMKDSGHSSYSAFQVYISSRTELRLPNVNLKDQIFSKSDFACIQPKLKEEIGNEELH
ncbi:site-specific integrase [Vibrio parahaemolyticus]|uniref:Site-specific integrase n=1 Tax=Vibrio parahaemolyticus TaxID=670 RepID=A0A9Q3UAV8_VIBPH|nr:site-specific integrase [Vibrio parahaemolyticus]EGQ9744517.1 site-specific integrase [Vibrio parahaemolyticus]EJE4724630.1 site-specific integrase [Vibrio parahaemolyticus]EJO2025995.1 site-specific integrase [Vibrio parahaemolyticus]MCC3803824.1 site-specific integrase [Vibrio parahaemolyticus]